MKKKAIVLITGVKLSPAKTEFGGGQIVTYLKHKDQTYKMNAGAGVVHQLQRDYEIICSGYNQSDSKILEDLGMLPAGRFFEADLLNRVHVEKLIGEVKKLKDKYKLPVHLVHYGGASDTKVDLPNHSLLAHTWDIAADAIPELVANNCVTLLNVLQTMKRQEIFTDQPISKVVFITAAAALRAKQMLGLDTTQKGAGHSLIRTIALDLTPENIYITEVMPGSTDTGFFDNDYTLNTAVEVTKNLGYVTTPENYPMFTSEQIGDSVKYVLDANCNVREVVLLPYGQFPHLGA